MKNYVETIKKSNFVAVLRELLEWRFFPFITAVVTLSCYYLGWDLVTIYFICLTVAAMLLLLKDLTPIIPQFLFMNVMISMQNSPLNFGEIVGSDFYTRIENLAQIVFVVALLIAAMIYRLVVLGKAKTFKPNLIFWALCVLSAAFVFNGLGSENYTVKNLLYGLLLSFLFLVVYVVAFTNVELTDENFNKIAIGFMAFSALLIIELALKYAVDYEKIYAGGTLNKQEIIMGWGVWNNCGMFFSICIPPVMLLASKSKYGYLYLLYAVALVAGAFFTGSRQAMLGSSFAFIICAVALLVKSRARLINGILLGILLVIALILIAVYREYVLAFIDKIMQNVFNEDGSFSGNGRMRLIRLAIDYFKANPFFGSGFFSPFESFELTGITDTLFPTFAHNTFAEILGTCGVFGIVSYLGYRVITVIGFFKKPSCNKFYMAACILTLLLICLLDNYIFYMLPTLIYSTLIPFATGEEKK